MSMAALFQDPARRTTGQVVAGCSTPRTVGYGDIVPKTTAGRFTGVFIMVAGVGILGVLAGSLASFFRVGGSDPETPDDGETSSTGLATQVVELRTQVAALTQEISRLATQLGESSGPTD
jgi:voltage-gated potassium channel